ncbi:hypothetical protein JCM11641_003999 [Rhodosporidiobolus odoratus]
MTAHSYPPRSRPPTYLQSPPPLPTDISLADHSRLPSPPSASSTSLKPPSPFNPPASQSFIMAHPNQIAETPGSEVKAKRSGPVIWGFNLSEMSFHAFKTQELMDKRYHLRKERVISYQLAMLVCLAAECCVTYSLSKYEDLQGHIETAYPPAHVYQNDIIDFQIVTIVMCVMVACLYGADFFFLVQFPTRTYPKWYQNTKKALAITITCGVFAAAVGLTVMIASHAAKVEHVSQDIIDAAVAHYSRPPLVYRKWAVNIASLCLLWPGWLFCVIATICMFMAVKHDEQYGAQPTNGFNSPSTQSISGVPLATPPGLHTTTDPRMSSGTSSTLPAGTGVHQGVTGDKFVLPNQHEGMDGSGRFVGHEAFEGGRSAGHAV